MMNGIWKCDATIEIVIYCFVTILKHASFSTLDKNNLSVKHLETLHALQTLDNFGKLL